LREVKAERGTVKDEIDFLLVLETLWKGKISLFIFIIIFSTSGVIYSINLANVYKSHGVYAPVNSEASAGMLDRYGGLAAMAGIDLRGSGSNDIDHAIALVKSWPFLNYVINKHKLAPILMGVKGWDKHLEILRWDESVYLYSERRWNPEFLKEGEVQPSSYSLYAKMARMIEVSQDPKSSLVVLSVEHYSPEVANQWTALLVDEINLHFQSRDIVEATKSVEYLKGKAQGTSISEMQSVFYGMIQGQMKKLMLAEISEEYLLSTIVEPMTAEVKSGPNRVLLTSLGMFFGFCFGAAWVLARSWIDL